MKFYVAGASAEWKRADRFMRALESLGHEITFDWTRPFAEGSSNQDLTRNLAEKFARKDAMGVAEALLIILVPPRGISTTGAWTELGIALGMQMAEAGGRIFVSAEQPEWWKTNIFLTLAHRHFPTDALLLEYIETVAV